MTVLLRSCLTVLCGSRAVAGLARLLPPGGRLVLQSALRSTAWHCGPARFPAVNTDRAFLTQCVAEAGLQLDSYKGTTRCHL